MRLTKEKLSEILLPLTSPMVIPYLVDVWEEHPFSLSVSRPHTSSFGYYRYHPLQGPLIRLNNNLSSSHFLMTYLHEVAHHRVQISQLNKRKKVAPHGKEWKLAFQQLMEPVLQPPFFPDFILPALIKHMQNPAATSSRDAALTQAFRLEKGERSSVLGECPVGHLFQFKGRQFKLLKHNRSRALCEDLSNQQKYWINRSLPI